MKDGFIALIDSGVGGISLLMELLRLLPRERYLYFGDNKNAPYGSRSVNELKSITFKNIDYIKRYPLKLIILACNTLSVNLLSDISEYSAVKTFGVFPPIESAVINYNKTLLLSTERTAENYKGVKGLDVVGLKDLASNIEVNAHNLSAVSITKNLKATNNCFINKAGYYDCVILGCTHYFFVKDKIFDHFRPQKILCGEKFTANAVKNYLKNSKSLVNYKENQPLFVGENAFLNQNFFNNLNKNL